MPTVIEQLKTAGWSDDDIAAFDKNKLSGIEAVFSAAENDRQQGELARRAAAQTFETEIAPALNEWGNRQANLTAERDYYKRLAEGAKDGGFVADVPPFKAADGQRDTSGRFVAGANPVPGSPDLKDLERNAGDAIFRLQDLTWKYQALYGKALPDAPSTLYREAEANRMPMLEWAAKKYDFTGREATLKAEEQRKHDDTIRKEERAAADREWAEKYSSNPNLRAAQPSRYTELRKGVTEGKREDPLKMSREQRHAATAAAIREDLAAAVN